ncbi:sulfatase-like hydrolase/transferase [Algibacillus agarilyticus]|uniref:sulfatase-like hydrolase/transferase n=1 Tax=Algibacillus agarilyticus TaxID=2234133 RepID=UPI001E2DC09D|nr:sulfatase-like hydrolase/transferase [Algibacillus agarilyticus]
MKTKPLLVIGALASVITLTACSLLPDGGDASQPKAVMNTKALINKGNDVVSPERLAKNVVKPLPAQANKMKPHILWILTDDQRADSIGAVNMALRGTKESELGYVESPNLDALAEEGVLFPLAYNQSPGCSPSRYSMATGQYPHHSGRYGFEYSHRQSEHAKPTIPEILREQGYQTMLAGKLGLRLKNGLNIAGVPLTYDYEVERYALERAGLGDWTKKTEMNWQTGEQVKVTEFFHYPDGSKDAFVYSRGGQFVSEVNPADKKLDIIRSYTRSLPVLILGGESPMPEDQTTDGKILQAFQNYLGNANKSYTSMLGKKIQGPVDDKPVMVSLSFHFPHTPVLPPKSFQDRFEKIPYKLPAFSQDEVTKLPQQLKNLYHNTKADGLTEAEKLRTIQDYYAFTAYGDSLIGKAIKDFKAYSKKTNRPYLIVATVGDHGWHLGEQGIQAKFAPWNKSGHGAMIVVDSSGEYFPKNTVHTDYVEYVDIAPTLYAAAGVDINKANQHLDGFNLANIIRQPELKRDYVLGEMNQIIGDRVYLRSKRFGFSIKIRPKHGKPGETHKAGENIMWAVNASPKQVEMALYDMTCDPNERNNVAYDPAYQDIVKALRTKTQNIFLGDNRLEVNWKKQNVFHMSDFAAGAHDRKLTELDLLPMPTCLAGI